MPLNPSTESIRHRKATIAEAVALTGLDKGDAVRRLLDEGIAARRVPVTVEEHAEAAHAAIERLREAVERLAATRGSPNPPPDMPTGGNGATVPEEANNG